MMATLLKGAVLGGLVVWLWGAVAWMVLPWSGAAMRPFEGERAVMEAVLQGAPSSGVYLAPNEATAEAERAAMDGPMVFAAVRREPMVSMGAAVVVHLLSSILAALLVTAIVLQLRPLTYGGRVLVVTGMALFAGLAVSVTHWTWWSFGAAYTLVEVGNLLVGWFLAGLVIARVARPGGARPAHARAEAPPGRSEAA